MTVVVVLIGAVIVLALLVQAFAQADARTLARAMRLGGPAACILLGCVALLAGSAPVGGVLFAAGLIWGASVRKKDAGARPRRSSIVRTAALEMEIDHRTGRLEGLVLAGTFEGKVLGRLHGPQLRRLHAELSGDPDSRQLLESYFDGRFPAWRKHAQPDLDRRKRVAPSPGAMTKEEAYKVLGLEAGAAAADVRKAHRRLMQRLHADAGPPSFLAARINEAKNVLLSDHG